MLMDVNINSGQIEVKSQFGSVFLYSHENGDNLLNVLWKVLSKNIRWDDADYFARMIFCNMIPKDEWDEELGYGIGPVEYYSASLLIVVNIVKQTIYISKYDMINKKFDNKTYSFAEFLNEYVAEANL
jgi:hypothetical protein